MLGKTLASLQQPDVATIYGFEVDQFIRFLVMGLVEGADPDSIKIPN